MARLSGARFCPEVNGCLFDPANYLDDPPGPVLSLKKWAYPRLARFVLSRADGIKTLFPRQLEGYRLNPRSRPLVESFFDYVDLEPFRDLGEERTVLFVGHQHTSTSIHASHVPCPRTSRQLGHLHAAAR